MEAPAGLKFSKQHEWVAADKEVATVGITDYAEQQLGEIVYVELPSVGDEVSKNDPFGVVESIKTASDVYAPLSGTVVAVNEQLSDHPEIINEDPYGQGWLIKVKIRDRADLDDLLESDEYEALVAEARE
ncbi:MAG: glycine cleavage system protein GcvH [Deltaproteobacteria bacterium]|nr:glycine cleavage system protein GcvH [Deltaproteobacteria bacterium]